MFSNINIVITFFYRGVILTVLHRIYKYQIPNDVIIKKYFFLNKDIKITRHSPLIILPKLITNNNYSSVTRHAPSFSVTRIQSTLLYRNWLKKQNLLCFFLQFII